MEPTPPPPPIIKIVLPSSWPGMIFKREKSASQAVILVKGMAADCSGFIFTGALAARRSSTS